MLRRLQLVRNVGKFESHTGNSDTDLASLTLVYGDNGMGKTTVCAILRSLRSGDPLPISERSRLGTPHPAHVVIHHGSGDTAVFQAGAWSETFPDMQIFDDDFVDRNVYSGLSVNPAQRQRLHEVVIGAEGVRLAAEMHAQTARISELHQALREREAAFPPTVLGGLSVAEFCAIPEVPDVDAQIAAAQRAVEALERSAEVREGLPFALFSPPSFPISEVEACLGRTLEDIDAAALQAVTRHLEQLGRQTEGWIATGMRLSDQLGELCPFCGQPLEASHLFSHYRSYFAEAYRRHQRDIAGLRDGINNRFSGDRLAAFQQQVAAEEERHRFWSQFLDLPNFDADFDSLSEVWQEARDQLLGLVSEKLTNPLELIEFTAEARTAAAQYSGVSEGIRTLSRSLQGSNARIARLKEDTATGNLAAVRADLTRLKRAEIRHSEEYKSLCDAYFVARTAKSNAEGLKVQIRSQLDEYRARVFPRYQQSINEILRRFNVGFRIFEMQATNPGGRPSSTYYLEINDNLVPVGAELDPGTPSFGSTLSAGDRTTLALAFFLAALNQEASLHRQVVVIDDPVSSLGDHRALVTAQEIRSLPACALQVIVLSHSKQLLCNIWQHRGQVDSAALEIRREGDASTIVPWNIHDAAVTEYDRKHELLRRYVRQGGQPAEVRQLAEALRPLLEGYLRVACSEHFPPGSLLGPFIEKARNASAAGNPILSESDLREVIEITEYANRFHHDTNPAWDTALVNLNETELTGFAQRLLDFTTHSP